MLAAEHRLRVFQLLLPIRFCGWGTMDVTLSNAWKGYVPRRASQT